MNKPPTSEIRDTALELTRAFLRLAGETDPDAAMKRNAQNTAQCVAAFAPVLEKFQDAPEVVRDYNELIMAVVRCFPGETRHQTALRYITEAEALR